MLFLQILLVSGLLSTSLASDTKRNDAVYSQLPRRDTPAPSLPSISSSLPQGCSSACSVLSSLLPGVVSFPNSTLYFQESLYWSQQQALVTPTCRVSPFLAEDIATTVLVVRQLKCQFALKSGGHAAFAGASNINDGITIDFTNMKEIAVNENQTETRIEPGNHWVDVYNELEKQGLSVIGGRVSAIGVGGLTLGGGISFFSGRYGWACDNVNNYEVVFADGSIHDVNLNTYPDLYFALRGGGNNFGIVTRFDLVTFPQGDMWGGQVEYIYAQNTSLALNSAFETFNINGPTDPFGQLILAYVYVQEEDIWLIVGLYEYGKPVVNPPIFNEIMAVPSISSTMRITTLSNLTNELNNSNPSGFRETYWAAMYKNSGSLITTITDIFMDEISNIQNVSGIAPSVVFQPISTAMTSHFTKNGGNALGITDEDGPLNVLNIAISWNLASDDDIVLAAARNTVNRAEAAAAAMNPPLNFRYIYQNYASQEQDVFAGYGEESRQRLVKIHEKYDPDDVWTQLQPGYFKIN